MSKLDAFLNYHILKSCLTLETFGALNDNNSYDKDNKICLFQNKFVWLISSKAKAK